MTDVASLSVSATETGVAKVDIALLGLAKSAGVAEAATGRFSAASKKAASENFAAWQSAGSTLPAFSMAIGKSSPIVRGAGVEMKHYGMHTANVFAQLNDIGVMMASGQNPLQLALQQGTQLNQVWGQMGGKVGAVGAVLRGAFMSLLNPLNLVTIGVIAGGAALVNYFTGGSDAAKTFSQKLDDLDTSLSRMNENVKIYSADGIQKLVEKYGEVNSQILQMINNQTQFDINNAMKLARESVSGLVEELGHIPDSTDKGMRFAGVAVANMARELDISKENVIALGDAMRAVQSADTFSEQSAALSVMNNILAQSSMKTDELAGNALRAQDIIAQLANSAPKASWMNASIDGVNSLIGRISAAITAANKLKSFSGTVTGSATAGSGAGTSGSGSFVFDGEGNLGDYGSGGGGGSDPYQANLDRLMSSLMTERETVEKWYADNEVILNDRRAMELLGAAGHKEAMLDLERQYHDKLSKIKDDSASMSLTGMSTYFGELNSIAGGGFDGLIRSQKSFAAAQLAIDQVKALSAILGDASIPFLAKGFAIGRTLASFAGLKSALSGGKGASGGGSSKAPTSVGGAAAEPTRTTTVSFQGDPFMVAIAEAVMSQMYEASGNGRVLIKA